MWCHEATLDTARSYVIIEGMFVAIRIGIAATRIEPAQSLDDAEDAA